MNKNIRYFCLCFPCIKCYVSLKKAPFIMISNMGADRGGTAETTSILGIVALGNASIDAAAKLAGIIKIYHVGEHITGVLGLFTKYKVVVYGE